MMKSAIAAVLLAVCATSLGCRDNQADGLQGSPPASKLTREYLLAHGYKQLPEFPDIGVYELKHARLADVSRDLGFPLSALEPTLNQPFYSDERGALVEGRYVRVSSEVLDKGHVHLNRSLDDPNTICTATVLLKPRLPRKFAPTDSTPRMRVKSATISKDRSKPLQITFELAAEGATPLGVKQTYFHGELSTQDQPRKKVEAFGLSFPEGTPQHIMVSPGKPIMLAVTSATWNARTTAPWSDLPAGEYVLRVGIEPGKDLAQDFDYHWLGTKYSDDYKLVVK